MKKLITITVLMAIAAHAFAYDFSAMCESGQTLYYNILSDHEVEITFPYDGNGGGWLTYPKPTGNLIIPDSITHNGTAYPVTVIGNNAFDYCDELTSIVIPDAVTAIGSYAFYHCSDFCYIVVVLFRLVF